jgi:hypothetical protein
VGGGISSSSVERMTKAFGAEVAAHKAEEAQQAIAVSRVGESPRERRVALHDPLPAVGNVSSDGVMVLVRGEGWKEAKMAVFSAVEVLSPADERRRRGQRRGKRQHEDVVRLSHHSYCVGLWDADTFGAYQYAEGLRRGLDLLDRCCSINDGARWIERITQANFPHAAQLVDWGHSVQHLWAVGEAVYGEDQPATAHWVAQRKDELWTGDVARVIRTLDTLDLDCPSYPDLVRQAPGYFRHNRKRMRYDRFRAQGYPVGSGTVESGAKNVVQRRLKRPGRGWNSDNAQAMLAALGELSSGRFHWAWQQVYHPAA